MISCVRSLGCESDCRVDLYNGTFVGKGRYDVNGKLHLYDIMDIKKKRATLSNRKILPGKKTITCFFKFIYCRLCTSFDPQPYPSSDR